MKILYGMGNRFGGSEMLSRFISHLDPKHELKIAAWDKASHTLSTVDWTLDSLFFNLINIRSQHRVETFGLKGQLRYNHHITEFIKDLLEFEPDLVISDDESYTACFANSFGIPLWYCSPLLLLNAWKINLGRNQVYRNCTNLQRYHSFFPKAEKYLVYSPLYDISFRPKIRAGFEWVKPYHLKIEKKEEIYDNMFIVHDLKREPILSKLFNSIDNSIYASYNPVKLRNIKTCKINSEEYKDYLAKSKKIVITGDTSHFADAFYAEKPISICPTVEKNTVPEMGVGIEMDIEGIVNATSIRNYNIGKDYGQVEFMGNFATDELNRNFIYNKKYLSVQKVKYLHEFIDDI